MLPTDLRIVDRLKERADLERTKRALACPEWNAPKLLGYIPSYNTTLVARKKSQAASAKKVAEVGPSSRAPDPHRPLWGKERLPIDWKTPDPFTGSSTEMPRAPFHSSKS